jgi:hypothetical protein
MKAMIPGTYCRICMLTIVAVVTATNDSYAVLKKQDMCFQFNPTYP